MLDTLQLPLDFFWGDVDGVNYLTVRVRGGCIIRTEGLLYHLGVFYPWIQHSVKGALYMYIYSACA